MNLFCFFKNSKNVFGSGVEKRLRQNEQWKWEIVRFYVLRFVKWKWRLGKGHHAFEQLNRMWVHSGITRRRKLELYMRCIGSKFVYSFEFIWMLKIDKTKLDVFRHRCLRLIVRIPFHLYFICRSWKFEQKWFYRFYQTFSSDNRIFCTRIVGCRNYGIPNVDDVAQDRCVPNRFTI